MFSVHDSTIKKRFQTFFEDVPPLIIEASLALKPKGGGRVQVFKP